MGFPASSDGKESVCNAGNPGLIPGSGRSPGGGNGNPLQYSCLENPMDRGAWRATAHGVTKSGTPPRPESTEAVFSPSKKKPRFAQGRWSVQRTCTLGFPIGQHWFCQCSDTVSSCLVFVSFKQLYYREGKDQQTVNPLKSIFKSWTNEVTVD